MVSSAPIPGTRAGCPSISPRLPVRTRLIELRAADLRFTPSEAAEFLNQVMGDMPAALLPLAKPEGYIRMFLDEGEPMRLLIEALGWKIVDGSFVVSGSQPVVYQIRIRGHLGPRWTDWFEGLTITLEEDGDTLLTGPVDQAALHGLLKKVRDLGMPFFLRELIFYPFAALR